MTSNNKIKLSKLLLSFSLILILIGISLNLENKAVMNPVTNTHVLSNSDTNDINITTTDTPIADNSSTTKDNNSGGTSKENSQGNNKGNNKSNSNSNTSSNNNSSGSNNNNSSTENKKTDPPSSSIEVKNNNLRNSIENKYGITVKYGVETNGYTVSGLSSVRLSDSNKINQVLNELNSNLSVYPAGLFNETKQGGYTLTIYLLKRYSQDNVTGITDSTTKNVLISLATDYSFEESLHHEIYHYIEKYMYTRGANYTTWNTLNPPDFKYGTTNSAFSYTTANNINAYFVNDYAQTDEYEDRASTFEYLMSNSEAGCLKTGTTIWKKAKYICEQIDAVFKTVTPSVTEYWERYVYN